MFGQHLVAAYMQIAPGIEHNFISVKQQDMLGADAFEAFGNADKRDVVRQAAFQTEHQRVKCTVSVSGQGERAVNVDDDANSLCIQTCRKGGGCLHRADRMRTGRPDTDFENIKNADHGFAPKGGFRRHGFRLTNQKETRHDARLLF